MKKKLFTISTIFFNSLPEALEKFHEWDTTGDLRDGSYIVEASKIYQPKKSWRATKRKIDNIQLEGINIVPEENT